MLRWAVLYRYMAVEAAGIDTMILLVGTVYAVLLAFTIFVIWGQFNEVENNLIHEVSALGDLIRFSRFLDDQFAADVRGAVRDYAHRAHKDEWAALAEGRLEAATENAFARLVAKVADYEPASPKMQELHKLVLDITKTASARRDERVAKSQTRIPPTLEFLVNALAGVLLILMFVYPFRSPIVGGACFVVASLVLFLANFVMLDTDNPLKGVWNVSPEPFRMLDQV